MSDFNLGTVTAYGYAKDKGYTGTEAEFAELMASYASVAESAAASAESAAASATTATTKAGEASTSASNAATSATTASTAATTATTKAGEASTSASTASTKASEATTAAATATTKAGEASTSATNAAGSATAAQTAQTGAETAKTAAETAQENAESSAESIAESAAQISTNTQNIAQLQTDTNTLKEDFNKIESDLDYQPELNLIDVSKISEGYELANQIGGTSVSATWYVTDWIEVEPDTKYTVSGVSSFYRAEVGADKSSYTGLGQNVATFTTGASTKYVRFNSKISGYSTPQLQLGDTATAYEPYKLVPQRIIDLENEVNDLTSDELKILLPNKIMCAVDKQISIYHKNILLCDNPDNYILSWGMNNFTPYVRCYDECVQIKPTAVVAETTCSLEVRSKFTSNVIATKTFYMQAYDTTLNENVVFIGDSLTDRAIYIAGIIENSESGITSVGTISDTVELDGTTYNILDEGRSGWYTTNYINSASYNNFTNAFYNSNTSTFDFSYYISANSIGTVDAVCILLGTNDISMSNIDYGATVANIQAMINSIHSYDSSIKVILGLTPQGALQSGWGNSNGRTGTATWFDYRAKTLVNKMIDAFSNASNIYLSPVYVNLSAVYDFPNSEVAESDRNPTLVVRETDNVHPNTYGYLKIADTIYGTLCGAFA